MSDAPANPIDAIACQWAARLDRGLAGEEEAALDAWLALDPRHRGALLRAQAGMALLDRCRALHDDDAPEQAPQDEAPDDHARWGATRRQALALAGVGVAGGLIGAAGLALWPQGSGIRTRIGEMRRVPLADGSMAVVNSGSELNVSFTPRRRDVDLAQGEAWFQVAKAPDRPFTVTAGRVRVQAVGTAFNVRRAGLGVDVVVTEGTVKVWSEGGEAQLVKAGQRARLDDGVGLAVSPIAADAAQQELAWREGQIVLDDVTLAQAAQRFNAYHEDRLEVDPALADKRVVGSFQTNDMDGFAQACAAMVGGRVERGNGVIRILR
ncbi:FecR family protein [Novosphingobium pokkalii]|uniref:FecR family protein n=1 Tax=Novosphingobium pokkalii TaxID=1770194 RepID=A0ABV7UXW4_9SPHN|nr:FecR domain-containing protein [Novosphingobium pokkalii]GHC94593.1 sensor [Novosphingobium pokkalii]